MKKLFLILPIFLSGCYVNERGISARYYNDCREYYDAAGMYHKVCDKNIIDYKDVTDSAKKAYNYVTTPKQPAIAPHNTQVQEALKQEEEDFKALDELEKKLEEEENDQRLK